MHIAPLSDAGSPTIVRTGDERFWFVTGAPSQRRVWDLLAQQVRTGDLVEIADRTDEYGVLTLAGPRCRDVLAACTEADLSDAGFPWLRAREIVVGDVPALAIRMSFSGRLA